ncbi:MAG: polysaccharide deacetylase family protein [Candidatus Anammoximicrobium sp.]|nr:polysaccharide deacetylase family protein [Candidatus Anammoximicrobium sp.]
MAKPSSPEAPLLPAASFSWPQGVRGALSISFDDARESQVEHRSAALFKQYGICVTYFVSLVNVEKKQDLWRAVAAAGHEIGNHSVHHPCSGNFPWIGPGERALENYTLEKIDAELLEANRSLHQMLGVTPVSYAYPCGLDFVGRGENRASYVPVVARHFLVGRGYRGEYFNNPSFCDLAMVQALGVDRDDLAQLKSYADQALATGYWLILVAHEVPQHPGGEGLSTGNIAALCEYLQTKPELWVDTVGAIGAYVKSHRNLDQKDAKERAKR